jgi:uncharacterized protein
MYEATPSEKAELATIAQQEEKSLYKSLIANRNKVFAIHSIQQLHQRIDVLASKVKMKPSAQFHCKPGCSFCCTLRIEALPPEVFLLARHLSKLNAATLSALIEKLKEHALKAKGVKMEDFFLPCPLLLDGKCSVYALRPSMCRKYFSLDVEACKKPEASAPEDSEMYMKSAAMLYGTNKAYGRAKLPNESHELGQALLVALVDSKAEDRWFNGEPVFEAIPECVN